MFVGAHPDDETTLGPLLARASEQTKVIVVCFTKGEGGANKIGPELDAMLGEIRVKELAAAARVLGVEHRILGFWNGLPGGMRNPENPRETPEQATPAGGSPAAIPWASWSKPFASGGPTSSSASIPNRVSRATKNIARVDADGGGLSGSG